MSEPSSKTQQPKSVLGALSPESEKTQLEAEVIKRDLATKWYGRPANWVAVAAMIGAIITSLGWVAEFRNSQHEEEIAKLRLGELQGELGEKKKQLGQATSDLRKTAAEMEQLAIERQQLTVSIQSLKEEKRELDDKVVEWRASAIFGIAKTGESSDSDLMDRIIELLRQGKTQKQIADELNFKVTGLDESKNAAKIAQVKWQLSYLEGIPEQLNALRNLEKEYPGAFTRFSTPFSDDSRKVEAETKVILESLKNNEGLTPTEKELASKAHLRDSEQTRTSFEIPVQQAKDFHRNVLALVNAINDRRTRELKVLNDLPSNE